jgi:hypothetical protein
MRAAIFAEGSQTTADSPEDRAAREYFQGAAFKPVITLENELSKYANTELHIFSEQFGYLQGDTVLTEISEDNIVSSEAKKEFTEEIIAAAKESDILVILLSSSTFEETVARHWKDILSDTRENSIWCFGASKSTLRSIDLPDLENKVDAVLIYERVGVAPLGQDTRDELVERVRTRCARE